MLEPRPYDNDTGVLSTQAAKIWGVALLLAMSADGTESEVLGTSVRPGKSSSRRTESEEYLYRLGQKAFLSLWAHPNVYTDEAKKPGKGAGKELCDLLVVFGDDVIIFSDKHVNFKSTGNLQVDWKRWYRRAIEKSMHQLFGARAWIERYPTRLFLDPACLEQFPIALPRPERMRVHLVAVTRGSYEACAEYYRGSSLGSLRISSSTVADTTPFTIGRVGGEHGFVHVFDEFTLEIVFRELDTVSDFVGYLRRKEFLLGNPSRQFVIAGEEQLLAIYLTNWGPDGNHDFVPHGHRPDRPEPGSLVIDTSYFQTLMWHRRYLEKKRADRASYAWDELISHFIESSGFPRPTVELPANWQEHKEEALRDMAREPRLRRRMLGASLFDFLRKAPSDRRFARVVRSDIGPNTAYVFLSVPFREGSESYDEYRRNRLAMLSLYCKVAPLQTGGGTRIVGIAFDAPGHSSASEELVVTDWGEFDDELRIEAEEVRSQFGILRAEKVRFSRTHVDEFPEPGDPPRNFSREQSAGPHSPASTANREQRRALAKRNRRKKHQ